MKTLFHETSQIIRFNFKNLLLFHMGYRLTAALVYLELLNAGMSFALKKAGYSYLTLENAWKVFLSPWTIPVIGILAGAGLFFLMIEVGGLIAAFSGAVYFIKMPAVKILSQGIQSTAEQLKRRNFSLFAVVLANFFVLNLFCLYRALTHIKPINFVIEEISAHPLGQGIMLAVVCLCVGAVIPTYFVFHECMTEQKFYKDGRDRSRRLLKGRYVKTIARVLCPQLLLIGAAVAVYLALVLIMAAFALLFVRRDLEFAFLIRAADLVEWMVMAVMGGISPILYYADLTVQYYQYENNKIGQKHYYETKEALLSRRNVLAVLSFFGIIGGLGLMDGAVNGSFLASAVVVQTEITAHRGSSAAAPENTIAALSHAVDEMADWAEIDVRETMDGVIVLFHDGDLKRIAGTPKRVAELTLEELKEVDAGSWFSEEFKGEKIPTLEEAMEYAKGRINLNIEMKYSGASSLLPDKVRELIESYEMEDQCIVTCTSEEYLKTIKESNPRVRTGYIIGAAYGNYYRNEYIDVISIRSGFVTESLIKAAHEEGKSVHAWTVNGKKELERMRVLGVDNVITDVPILAREILYREEGTENLLEYLRLMFY